MFGDVNTLVHVKVMSVDLRHAHHALNPVKQIVGTTDNNFKGDTQVVVYKLLVSNGYWNSILLPQKCATGSQENTARSFLQTCLSQNTSVSTPKKPMSIFSDF